MGLGDGGIAGFLCIGVSWAMGGGGGGGGGSPGVRFQSVEGKGLSL